MKHNVAEVIANLDKLIADKQTMPIDSVYQDLNIFDWFKNNLTVKNMKDMRTFLNEAQSLGFKGYCCFKVGAVGCANGMWAYRDDSVTGHSPSHSPTLYKSFSPSYNYWSIDVKGDGNWLPKDQYNKVNTLEKFREITKDIHV